MTGKTSKWIDLASNSVLRELSQAHQAALVQNALCRKANVSTEQVTKEVLNPTSKRAKKSRPRSTREDAESRSEKAVSLEITNDGDTTRHMPKPKSKKKKKQDKMLRANEEDAEPGIQTSGSFIEIPPEIHALPSSKKKKTSKKRPKTDTAEEVEVPSSSRTYQSVKEISQPPSESNPSLAPKKKKSNKKKCTAESQPTKDDAEPPRSTSQTLIDGLMATETESRPKQDETSKRKPNTKASKPRAKTTKTASSRGLKFAGSTKGCVRPRATYVFSRQKVPGLILRAKELLKKWKEPIPTKGTLEFLNMKLCTWCNQQTKNVYTYSYVASLKPTNMIFILMELRKSLIRHDWPGTKKILKVLLRCRSSYIFDRLSWKIMVTLFMNYPGAGNLLEQFVEENRCAYSSNDIMHGLVTINGMSQFTKYKKKFKETPKPELQSKDPESQDLEIVVQKV